MMTDERSVDRQDLTCNLQIAFNCQYDTIFKLFEQYNRGSQAISDGSHKVPTCRPMEDFSSEVAESLVVDPASVETAVFLEVNMAERISIHSVDVFNDSVNVVGSVPVFPQDIYDNIVNHSLSLPNGKARTKVYFSRDMASLRDNCEIQALSCPWWGLWPNATT